VAFGLLSPEREQMTNTDLSFNFPVLLQLIKVLKDSLGNNLVAAILFGSRARGDAHPESDWDILIIAHHLPKKHWNRYQQIKNLIPPDLRGNISILAKTPGEFEKALPSLYLDIALDGIILYDTDQYSRQKFNQLKAIIHKKGLQRANVNGNLIWSWDQFPGFDWSLEWEST